MKILFITHSFYPATYYGGPVFSLLNICKTLSEFYEDIYIYVVTTNANGNSKLNIPVNKWLKIKGFYVKYYNESSIGNISYSLLKNIYKDIKESEVLYIQAIFNYTTPISLVLGKLFNKPIIISPRGSLSNLALKNKKSILKKLWLMLLIKPFCRHNIIWHATSCKEKEWILNIFSNADVRVIPNGISTDKYKIYKRINKDYFIKRFVNRKNNSFSEINKIIVSMGRLHKIKGFDVLINSFDKVLSKYPHSYLLIAGPDGGEKNNLLRQIKELNLEHNIFLIGEIKGQDKIDFLANADLFVLPSHSENFGNVYLESLAAGTPIVASKNTPWEEVEKYNCGKWVENSVEEISKAMIEMLSQNREEMRENSIKLASKYDWSNIAKQFKELFKEMINE